MKKNSVTVKLIGGLFIKKKKLNIICKSNNVVYPKINKWTKEYHEHASMCGFVNPRFITALKGFCAMLLKLQKRPV